LETGLVKFPRIYEYQSVNFSYIWEFLKATGEEAWPLTKTLLGRIIQTILTQHILINS